MKRRTFVKNSVVTAFSVAAFGSIHWNGKTFVGDTVTTTDILGPFYRPGAPMRSNLIPAGSKGDVLRLSGVVFKTDGRTPLGDALVEAWQCDENEHYDNTSDEFIFRGAVKTDKGGNYNFKTIVPVPYEAVAGVWRPAHIHLRISSADHQDLITQIYFKGDEYLSKDTSSVSPNSANRILEISKTSSGEKNVKFDVVMGRTYPLSDEGYKAICGLYLLSDGRKVEFYREDDLLFWKMNGQIHEALMYKGNNSFEGGLGFRKVQFELQAHGETKVKISVNSTPDDPSKLATAEGVKFLKY